MAICVHCTNPVPVLYTVYNTAHNLRLEQCNECKQFADPYVEHDSLLLLMDLILLKRDVFRHLLFNRGTKPRVIDAKGEAKVPIEDVSEGNRARWRTIIKLGSALVLLDTFIRWSELYPLPPPESSAARISWSAEATHAFGLMFLSCLTETLAFHGGVILACFLLLPIARFIHRIFVRSPPSGTELQFRLSHVPLTLFYSSLIKLFLLFLLTIWRPTVSTSLLPTPTALSPFSSKLPPSVTEPYVSPLYELDMGLPPLAVTSESEPLSPVSPVPLVEDGPDDTSELQAPASVDESETTPLMVIEGPLPREAYEEKADMADPSTNPGVSLMAILDWCSEHIPQLLHQASTFITSTTSTLVTQAGGYLSQQGLPSYLAPIPSHLGQLYSSLASLTSSFTQILPSDFDVHEWASFETIRPALELFDEDKLDREWVVRNVLGGMAAGFGLRVTLDAHPLVTTLVILSGWTFKTLASSSDARALFMHNARHLYTLSQTYFRSHLQPFLFSLLDHTPESLRLLYFELSSRVHELVGVTMGVAKEWLGPVWELVVERVGPVLEDVALAAGFEGLEVRRAGRRENVGYFAYTGI